MVKPGAQRSQKSALAEKWNTAAVDLRAARTAESLARVRLLDLEYEETTGTLWREEHLRPFFARVWAGLRTQLLELPQRVGGRVNPTDPEHASRILEEEVRRILDATVSQLDAYVPEHPSTRGNGAHLPDTHPGRTGRNGHANGNGHARRFSIAGEMDAPP